MGGDGPAAAEGPAETNRRRRRNSLGGNVDLPADLPGEGGGSPASTSAAGGAAVEPQAGPFEGSGAGRRGRRRSLRMSVGGDPMDELDFTEDASPGRPDVEIAVRRRGSVDMAADDAAAAATGGAGAGPQEARKARRRNSLGGNVELPPLASDPAGSKGGTPGDAGRPAGADGAESPTKPGQTRNRRASTKRRNSLGGAVTDAMEELERELKEEQKRESRFQRFRRSITMGRSVTLTGSQRKRRASTSQGSKHDQMNKELRMAQSASSRLRRRLSGSGLSMLFNRDKITEFNMMVMGQHTDDNSALSLPWYMALEQARQKVREDAGGHDEDFRFTINPNSTSKHAWDWFIILLVVYNSIFIPLDIAFKHHFSPDSQAGQAIFAFDIVVDILFGVDILLSFRTELYDHHGGYIKDSKVLAEHYIKTWFVIDLIAVIPVEEIAQAFAQVDDQNIGSIALLKTVRLLRIGRLMKKFEKLAAANVLRIFNLMASYIVLVHWFACIWFWLSNKHQNPELQPAYEEEKWTVLMKIDDESTPLHIQYGYAFNWALTAVLPGSAYVLPGTHTERIFSSIVMIAGALMNAFVFGNVAALIQRFDHLQAQYSSLLDQLKAFSSHHRFPKDLNDRMLQYIEKIWDVNGGLEIEKCVEWMPKRMKYDIYVHVYEDLVKHTDLFKHCDVAFVRLMASKFEVCLCLPDEILIGHEDPVEEMYFITRGNCGVISKECKYLAILKAGQPVGHIALLKGVTTRTASVVALEYCELVRLDRKHFNECLEQYPDHRERLANLAQNIEKTYKQVKDEDTSSRKRAGRGRRYSDASIQELDFSTDEEPDFTPDANGGGGRMLPESFKYKMSDIEGDTASEGRPPRTGSGATQLSAHSSDAAGSVASLPGDKSGQNLSLMLQIAHRQEAILERLASFDSPQSSPLSQPPNLTSFRMRGPQDEEDGAVGTPEAPPAADAPGEAAEAAPAIATPPPREGEAAPSPEFHPGGVELEDAEAPDSPMSNPEYHAPAVLPASASREDFSEGSPLLYFQDDGEDADNRA